MTAIQKAREAFHRHGGMMRTADMRAAKIHHYIIQELLKNEYIEHVRRGYYQWTEKRGPSDIEILSKLFPDAIYCMNTALYFYQYTDRIPDEWHISVDKNSNRKRFCLNYPAIKPYYTQPELRRIGISTHIIDGVKIQMHDRDRTICDCLRYHNKMDREVFNKSIRAYIADPAKNLANLLDYATRLRCSKKVSYYIEPWL